MNYTDQDKLTIIRKQLNFTCSTFTSVVMLKLQLQEHLFEDADETEISGVLQKLIHLESVAAILNNIAVSDYNF